MRGGWGASTSIAVCAQAWRPARWGSSVGCGGCGVRRFLPGPPWRRGPDFLSRASSDRRCLVGGGGSGRRCCSERRGVGGVMLAEASAEWSCNPLLTGVCALCPRCPQVPASRPSSTRCGWAATGRTSSPCPSRQLRRASGGICCGHSSQGRCSHPQPQPTRHRHRHPPKPQPPVHSPPGRTF